MLKKIFTTFVIVWVCCGIYAPICLFDKPLETFNAFEIFSFLSFFVLMLSVIAYVLSGIGIELYFKLKR